MSPLNLNLRTDVSQISRQALLLSDFCENQLWKGAYLDLAHAADRVDAMLARSTAPSSANENNPEPLPRTPPQDSPNP